MKCISYLLQAAVVCIGLAIPAVLPAQQPVLVSSNATTPVADKTPPLAAGPAVVSTQNSTAAPTKPLFSRWIDLTEMSESQRYRNSYDENGARLFADGQQRTVVSGHFKFDEQGRYFIGFRASSGRYFNWSYADYIGHDYLHYAGLSLNHFTPAEYTAFFNAV